MVSLKKRPIETPVNPKQINSHEHQSTRSESVSSYEQCREKRIKENLERMQKLGLFDLSSKLKSDFSSPKRSPRPYTKRTPQSSPLDINLSARRSTRLQNGTPICYAEEPRPIRAKGKRRAPYPPRFFGVGSRDEVYTEEHDKFLGSTEKPWTLFVDGCGPDGRRIYDQVKGKSCHQCRQKTMGHRTHCNECGGVRGQFCGDCLYMRYGEHVLEANENPDWICPPCRGICNCSLCRNARGWPPTGQLYKHISTLGFKSVAHYLIQTRRAETKLDDAGNDDQVAKSDDAGNDDPVTVKRSLPFAETEEEADHKEEADYKEFLSSHDGQNESPTHIPIDEKKKESVTSDSAHGVGDVSSANEATVDSIGKRLRQRRNKSSLNSENLVGSPMQPLDVDSAPGGDCDVSASMASPGSIAKRLRQRSNKSGDKGNSEDGQKEENGGGAVNEHLAVIGDELNLDSISGRLRQRRNRVL